MTFYEELRAFFKKYDPARIRLAKKIAAKYRKPRGQKAVMRRLKEVYAAGGPDKFDFSAGKKPAVEAAPVAEAPVVEEATSENTENSSDERTEVSE
ncbi:hypothetical protein [Parvicella tangerina]|uniref:Uncharacterized protein n=1 Tax=Parvicella tangerina TaxID=2829795 RepID=A0A916NRS0_9FLAO|nr:hypothetical protein [Parvicella tangerina]CAG5081924.1 hypothetical protein CRYO30217_01763 [Parvicella tangerina]